MNNVQLVIIDPQNDFCDPKGALYVPGADEDMSRVSKMVDDIGEQLTDIHVTIDSHHVVDVAHPIMWKNSSGDHPSPFTTITASDVEQGVWVPTRPSLTKRFLDYVKALEAGGRYPLCIWPPHCLIGSWGQNVVPGLFGSFIGWEQENFAVVHYVTKGSNIFTEHYGALKAEVPDPQDPSTQLNTEFIDTLREADTIALCGEAGSHCLANTVRDIADGMGDDSNVKKFVLLIDGTSPVTGFENLQRDFVKEMTGRGMQICKCEDFLV